MMDSEALSGRVAVVTGGSRGIGRAVAADLARVGAHVIVNYRTEAARADEAVGAIVAAGGRAEAIQADVGRSQEASALVERVLAAHGRIDVIVNNAAIQRSAMLHKMSDEDWEDVLRTNLSGSFYLCRAALPSMLAARWGRIVNIASASSFMGQRGAASYVASKHGLIGLTRALAVETAGKGILVNAVAPGLTETDLLLPLDAKQREGLLSMVPLKRIADPSEVASMVTHVITSAHYSTGNVFHVGGGVVMS